MARGRNREKEGEKGGGGVGLYTGAVFFFKLYRKLPAARCARDTTRTRQPLPAVMACYATSGRPTTTADSHSIPSDIRILVLENESGRACVSRDFFPVSVNCIYVRRIYRRLSNKSRDATIDPCFSPICIFLI